MGNHTDDNTEKRYNRSFDTQIAIWSILAEYATKEKPLSVMDICKKLEKKREYYLGKREETAKTGVSKSTVNRYLPGAAEAINSQSRSVTLMEKGGTNVKFAYFESDKLHVVLEREGDVDGKTLQECEMAVILELHEPIEARYSTIANLLNKYPPDENTLYGTGLTPLRLKCVMAQNTKTGRRRYIPYQTLADDDDDERSTREDAKKADVDRTPNKGERPNNRTRYYYLESILSAAEWRIFADLVKVYPYITEKQTKKFLSALKQLNPGSAHNDDFFFNERYAFKRKNSGEFFKNIDLLDTAIRNHRAVTINYGEYVLEQKGPEWKPVLRQRANKHRKGGVWLVEPYALMWSNGYYYLVGNNADYGMMNLRVDRILQVTIPPDDALVFQPDESFDPYEYRDRSPVMYPGNPEPVRLRCKEDMVNVLLDFFGTQAKFSEPKDGYTTVSLSIAPKGAKLFAMQYADRVEVLEPASLRDEVREALQAALQTYNK